MSPILQRRYERLLYAYPAPHRREHGAEMVGTLLDQAEAGQRRPPLREAAALLREGLRMRCGAHRRTSGRQLWLSVVRMSALLLLAYCAAPAFGRIALEVLLGGWLRTGSIDQVAVGAVDVLALAAVASNRYRVAATAVALSVAVGLPNFGRDVENFLSHVLVLLLVGLLVRYRPIERPAPGRWLLAVPAMAVLLTGHLHHVLLRQVGIDVPWSWLWLYAVVLVTALLAGAVDPRVPPALGILLIPMFITLVASMTADDFVDPILLCAALLPAPALVSLSAVAIHRRLLRL